MITMTTSHSESNLKRRRDPDATQHNTSFANLLERRDERAARDELAAAAARLVAQHVRHGRADVAEQWARLDEDVALADELGRLAMQG
jgi:hypothetical protein